MSSIGKEHSFNITTTEFRLILVLFLLLWTYLFIRSFTVFYVHDEIVTKWIYIVHWNPFPNQGEVDANNHFLLSLLGGAFTRMFGADSMFLTRLGSLLAFPIYFWSIFKLKFLFRQKWNFYALLISLTTTTFLIEFFGLARGYGLSFAFLVLSLQQMASYFGTSDKKALLGASIGWLLAVYSSLTLLPFALLGMMLIGIFTVKRKFYFWVIPVLIVLAALAYFIKYSFLLRELGKLYYGGTEGFFADTVQSLTLYLWKLQSSWLDAGLIVLFVFIVFVAGKEYWRTKNLFNPRLLFSLFFLISIGSILGQHWILDVNFPEDRTASYLIIFFFGSLMLSFDLFSARKIGAFCVIGVSSFFFVWNFNLSHSIAYHEEHLDSELVTKIPDYINGTPTTTSGRWNMENELTRQLNLPLRVYQRNDQVSDTLVDYMIFYPERQTSFLDCYNVVHQDEVSGLALLERKKFLPRSKTMEVTNEIMPQWEFQTLHQSALTEPKLLRCNGEMSNLTLESEVFIVFTSEDSLSRQAFTYEAVPIVRNTKISKDGKAIFDFTYALNALDEANSYKVYIWNQNKEEIQGKIKLEVYSIDE